MRPLSIAALLLAAAVTANAQEKKPASPEVKNAVIQSFGACNTAASYIEETYGPELPKGHTSSVVSVESDSQYCAGRYAFMKATNGDYWIGSPWILSDYEGTAEERLKQFTTERLRQPFKATVKRDKLYNGMYRVDLTETTENGRMTIEGLVDPDAKLFLIGSFLSKGKPAAEQRLARLASLIEKSPKHGSAKAKVSVVEFSDFQCPSCQRSATFLPTILEKYGEKVRYTRVDLPLMNAHPWAYGAAVIGRAIYRQSPAAFWEYKKAVYSSQDSLNLFTLEDFARGFVADHELDVKKYEADLASASLKQEILDSIGGAFSNSIVGTPTYLVDGEIVLAGPDGANLDKQLAERLK
jgi:protein-disulfide isomerase